MRESRRLGAAGVLTLSLVLVGCAGDGEPDPPATTSSETESGSAETATPSETVAAPELPREATARTDLGAAAFVDHWFDLVNFGYQTGDVELARTFASESCSSCDELLDGIEDGWADGARLEGGAVTLGNVVSGPVLDGSTVVTMTYEQAEGSSFSRAGSLIETVDAQPKSLLSVQVHWTADDRWNVLSFVKGDSQ